MFRIDMNLISRIYIFLSLREKSGLKSDFEIGIFNTMFSMTSATSLSPPIALCIECFDCIRCKWQTMYISNLASYIKTAALSLVLNRFNTPCIKFCWVISICVIFGHSLSKTYPTFVLNRFNTTDIKFGWAVSEELRWQTVSVVYQFRSPKGA